MNKKFKLLRYKNHNLLSLYKWKTEKVARSNSQNKKVIEFHNHKKWVNKKVKYKKNMIYILYYIGMPAGMCAIIKKKKFYYLNYTIDKKFRKKGFSNVMLGMFLKKIKIKIYKDKVFAIVVKKNLVSYKILNKLKFTLYKKNKDYLKLKLNF